MKPFDIINDISQTKKDLIRNSENPKMVEDKIYNPWLINKNFSLFMDTVLYANEMNIHWRLPHIMQHDFFINSLRSKKRFAKWPKKMDNAELDMISEYYNVNRTRAEEYLELLSPDDLETIRKTFETGGIKNEKRKTTK